MVDEEEWQPVWEEEGGALGPEEPPIRASALVQRRSRTLVPEARKVSAQSQVQLSA